MSDSTPEEYERLLRDAKRYRWLRSDGLRWIRFEDDKGTLSCDTSDSGLDSAIDHAISPGAAASSMTSDALSTEKHEADEQNDAV